MAKIPVAVLAATGAVGQRFVQLLSDHPWFEIAAVTASEKKVGKKYIDACHWVVPGEPPPEVRNMVITSSKPTLPARLVFSALPASVAWEVEPVFAQAGYAVCSNASAYRYEDDVPMVIPEVNADHLILIELQRAQRGWLGLIVTSPNCTTTGCVIPLKALDEAFELEQVFATSMQAVSGAGYPGVSSLDILDNIIPYIKGEEQKIEKETCLLLGRIVDGQRVPADIAMSTHANRVPVTDGHSICLSVGFRKKPTVEAATGTLAGFQSQGEWLDLPSAPDHPIIVSSEEDRPQPRRDRDAEGGMVVTVGRVRPCPILDLRMFAVVHNTLRGAAKGSILNAELLVSSGYIQ